MRNTRDEHLVQIWPAPPVPETIHKATDEIGAGYREAASGPEPRLPHGRFVALEVHRPVTTTDRATVELLRLQIYRGGCEFMAKAVVDVSA